MKPKRKEMKVEGLRLYNEVLNERKVRKQFIKDYGVLCHKRNRPKNVKLSDNEARIEEDIADNLSLFVRYTEDKNRNFAEFKCLVSGLLEEKRLREKIYKSRHYLLNGITSVSKMEQIEKYVQSQQELKKKIIIERRLQKKQESANNSNSAEIEMDFELDGVSDFDIEIEEETNLTAVTSEQYMSQYHGCSLDAISRYLQLVENESNTKNKKRRRTIPNATETNEGSVDENGEKDESEKLVDEGNERSIETMKGYKELNEGEQKLCKVLNISPFDYERIGKEIANKIETYGLIQKGQIPQQLWIDIGDVHNVPQTMTMKAGLVDPRVIVDDENTESVTD